MVKAIGGILIAMIFAMYLYGIFGFFNAYRGQTFRSKDFYAQAIIWNFIFIVLTIVVAVNFITK